MIKNLICIGVLFTAIALADSAGPIISGYADAGYKAAMINKIDGESVYDTNKFLIREGGIFIGQKWGAEWQALVDLEYTGNLGNSTGIFSVSQAYISQNTNYGISWKLGEFDNIFGYYAGRRHSFEHSLVDTGILQHYFAFQHVGLQGAYDLGDIAKISAIFANDVNPTSRLNKGTRNPSYGVNLNSKWGILNASGGILFTTGSVGVSRNGYIGSLVIEADLDPLTAGIYGLYNRFDQKEVADDYGLGVQVGFNVTQKTSIHGRFEYLRVGSGSFSPPLAMDDMAFPPVAIKSAWAATLGPEYAFNENLKLKLDYTLYEVNVSQDSIDPAHIIQAAIVANF